MKAADLPRRYNPKEGYITTANNDLNAWEGKASEHARIGDYRARRIAQVLGGAKPHR